MSATQFATVDDLDPGDVVCLVTDSDGVEVVQWATPAVLAATGRHHGVASQAASKGGAAIIITGGTIRKAVHGLTAISSRVRVTNGRFEAVDAYQDGDYPGGFLNARGDLYYQSHDVLGPTLLDPYADQTEPAPLPGATATYTEATFTYDSSIDAAVTDLFGKYCYDAGLGALGDLPIMVVAHSYVGGANEVTQTTMRRWAARGFLAVSFGMRGRDGATGSADSAGREPYDILDGLDYVLGLLPAVASEDKAAGLGGSGGGGIVFSLCCKAPDRFVAMSSLFGISDYGYDTNDGWYYFTVSHRAQLVSEVGDREIVYKPYRARDATESIAKALTGGGFLYLFHDELDGDVSVTSSRRVRDAMAAAGLRNFEYNESNAQSAVRWTHGLPEQYPDLIEAERHMIRRARGAPAWTVPTRGRLRVIGWVKTRRFEIWLGNASSPRSAAGGGKDCVAEVEYDTIAATYYVTPLTGATVYVQIIQGNRNVSKQITGPTEIELNSPDVVTISALSDLEDCVLELHADVGITLAGSDVSVWADQSGAGNNFTEGSFRPLFEAALDGAAAVTFDSANSERLGGPLLFDPNEDYTVVIVAKPDNVDGFMFSQCSAAAFGKDYVAFRHLPPAAAIHAEVDDAAASGEVGTSTSSLDWHFYPLRRTTDVARVQVDGNTQATVASPGAIVGSSRSALGCLWDSPGQRIFSGGHIRSVGVWTRSLTDGEVISARNFLKAKWPGLP